MYQVSTRMRSRRHIHMKVITARLIQLPFRVEAIFLIVHRCRDPLSWQVTSLPFFLKLPDILPVGKANA